MADSYNTQVVILRNKILQNMDKLYICYSRELGKIPVIAYGIGNNKNRYNGLMQPFNNLEMQLRSSKRYELFQQAELIGNRSAESDIDFLAYASVLTELTEYLTPDRQPEPEVYELLVRCLELLRVRNKRLVTIIFTVKLLSTIGVGRDFLHCTSCEKDLEANAFFDGLKEGIICGDCCLSKDFEVTHDVQILLDKFTKIDLSNKIEFSVTGGQLKQLERLAYTLIRIHIDKPLKSLIFLNELLKN